VCSLRRLKQRRMLIRNGYSFMISIHGQHDYVFGFEPSNAQTRRAGLFFCSGGDYVSDTGLLRSRVFEPLRSPDSITMPRRANRSIPSDWRNSPFGEVNSLATMVGVWAAGHERRSRPAPKARGDFLTLCGHLVAKSIDGHARPGTG
jgi:hypothetical protein